MLTSRSQPELPPQSSPKRKPAPPTFARPFDYAFSSDVHMTTFKNITSNDLMAHAARNGPTSGLPIMDNDTLNDVRMETARAGGTMVKSGLQLWELELIESPEVKRKATVAQLCVANICGARCGQC
jgi:cell cycle protein kinase DBF2